MPCTGDIFNHHNKELVGIKLSCKGTEKLSEQAGSEFVGSRVQDLTLCACVGMRAFVHFSFLVIAHDYLESETITYILPDSAPKRQLQANKFHYNSPKRHSFRAF